MKTYMFITADCTKPSYPMVIGMVKAKSMKDAERKINKIPFVDEKCHTPKIYEVPDGDSFCRYA